MQVGNKAESLKKMYEYGFAVPAFSVVTSDLYKDLRLQSNRQELVAKWLDGKITIDPEKTYAVRSSGNKEDSSSASFAGLFSTYLDVSGKNEIVESILKCWDAVDTERVKSYCQQKKIDPHSLEMSVIIQEFVAGDFSGVVFTMNPQNGHQDQIIVELVKGCGEKLVSGQVNPDFFKIKTESNSFAVLEERKKENLFLTAAERDSFLKVLIEQAKSIQSHFRSPQDIEFTVKDGKIYFLQSRPITFFNYSEYETVWTTADFRDGGVSSAVVSPVMWSLYGNVFNHSMESYFRYLGLLNSFPKEHLKWFQVLYGKPYWNVELVKRVQLQLPGFREDTFDQDLSIPKVYDGRGRESGWSLGKIIKAIPVLLKISSGFSKQERIAMDWIENFSTTEKKWRHLDWSSLKDDELIARSKELYSQQFKLECDYFTTIYNASNAKMFFLETLTALQKKIDGLNYTELIKSMESLSVLSPLNSLNEIATKIQNNKEALEKISVILYQSETIPSDRTHELVVAVDPEIGVLINQFFEKYYHHSTKELDLRVPRWAEDKSFFYSTLKSTLDNPVNAKNRKTDVKNPSLQKVDDYFALHAMSKLLNQKAFYSKLERLKKFLWLREEVRDRSTRMYYFIRQWLLFLNQKYKVQDLFFYLTVEDIFEYLQSPGKRIALQEKAMKVKSYAQGFEGFKNPNEVGLKAFAGKQAMEKGNDKTLFGLACSPGRVQGTVRVLKTIHDSQALKQGEIMVVPYTDPGWTPLFGLTAGVITETGGLLSHAALIAREYSIPAVLNIPDATEKLKTGMQIELDGTSGRILILSDV
jgi:phosphohistidine swiveling domain-containing protein